MLKIRCPACGRNVKIKPGATSASCRHCGASMPLAGMHGPSRRSKDCPVCSAKLEAAAQNCPRCGWNRVGEAPALLRRRRHVKQLAWVAPLALLAILLLMTIESWRIKAWILADALHHAAHCLGMLAAGRVDAMQPGLLPAGGAAQTGLLMLHLLLVVGLVIRWHNLPWVRWSGLAWLIAGSLILHHNLELDFGLALPALAGQTCAAAALLSGLRVDGPPTPFPARFLWLAVGLTIPLLQILEILGFCPSGALSQDLTLLGERRGLDAQTTEKSLIFSAALLPFTIMAISWIQARKSRP
ncbi:MAG: Double zinc ribbon [Verrucomicrobiota bacterium]|jgi:predicted RNA-binding Zn-ribbon protein involved in translation (DUF1610 family)